VTYEDLGVRKLINAAGTLTIAGGSCTYPEVVEAMKRANENYVMMDELQVKSGSVVAELFGTEAALVTAGCFSALVLATAACMTKDTDLGKLASVEPYEMRDDQETTEWIDRIRLLPDFWRWKGEYPSTYLIGGRVPSDLDRIRNEVILQWCHKNNYDHAYRAAGARLVYVGTRKTDTDRIGGVSSSTCTPEQLEETITEKTAAVSFVTVYGRWKLGVHPEEICKIAHEHDVPVIADCASMEPPRANLQKVMKWGVDLACWSGGKQIRGPNDTGFLVGRKGLVDLARLHCFPHHGIGRGYKAEKASIVGAVTALQTWLRQDEEAEFDHLHRLAKYFVDEFEGVPGVRSARLRVTEDPRLPFADIEIDEKASGKRMLDMRVNLKRGPQPIWTAFRLPNILVLNPYTLKEGEEKVVAQRLKEELKGAR